MLSSLAIVAACSSAYSLTACSDDDDGNGDGTGGTSSSGGKSGSGGKTGSGGAATGGKSGSGGGSTGGTSSGGASSGGGVGTGGETDGGETDGGDTDSGEPGTNESGVRFVHAATGGPNIDVYRKGSSTPLATDVEYGSASAYVTVAPGTYQFEVRSAGTPAAGTPAFTSANVVVTGGKNYTEVAAGDLASPDAADKFRILTLEENFGDNASGKTRVRFVHASYDGPTVGVDVGNDDPTAPEIASVARFGNTDEEGAEVDSGEELQIGVTAAGGTLTSFTTPELPSGKNVIVVASGLVSKFGRDPLGLRAIAVLPDSTTVLIKQNPRIYAVHASPDAGAVDAFVGTTEVIDNSTFGKMSPLQVPPGTVKLDFFAAVAGKSARPAGAPAVTGSTGALEAGNTYLVVAAGAVGSFSLLTAAEGFDPGSATTARLRVLHASSDAPSVDIGTVTTPGTLVTPAIFEAAKYKDITPAGGTALPIGPRIIGVAVAGTTTTAAEFSVAPTANDRLFAIAAGRFTGTPNPIQLLVVNTTGLFWTITPVLKN